MNTILGSFGKTDFGTMPRDRHQISDAQIILAYQDRFGPPSSFRLHAPFLLITFHRPLSLASGFFLPAFFQFHDLFSQRVDFGCELNDLFLGRQVHHVQDFPDPLINIINNPLS